MNTATLRLRHAEPILSFSSSASFLAVHHAEISRDRNRTFVLLRPRASTFVPWRGSWSWDKMADPASVLAFVLVGLKSAKIAHEALSSFKDGPKRVRRATADVKRLRSTLERLSQCRALEGPSGESFVEPMEACLEDLNDFARKLTHLTLEPQGSRRKKYWKRLMAVWDEKALSEISDRVANHTVYLNIELGLIQG